MSQPPFVIAANPVKPAVDVVIDELTDALSRVQGSDVLKSELSDALSKVQTMKDNNSLSITPTSNYGPPPSSMRTNNPPSTPRSRTPNGRGFSGRPTI